MNIKDAISNLQDTEKERHTLEALTVSGMPSKEKIELIRVCQELGAERSHFIRACIVVAIQNYRQSKQSAGSSSAFKP